ncbi:hypothetical protein P7C70_g8037, partial [Phenoliferia sp. Uapishka_3]
MTAPRPLIDIERRSSSRDPHQLHSNPTSPYGSPVGSPPLRSAMKLRTAPSIDSGFDIVNNSSSALSSALSPSADLGEERGRSGAPLAGVESKAGTESRSSLGGGGSKGSMYERRVGFDTFESGVELESTGSQTGGGTGINYSFTVSAKSAGFERTKQTRTYLVGTDLNGYSVHALNWALSHLADNNDEIVVLRVIDEAEGLRKRGGMTEAKDEAEQVLEEIMRKNGEELKLSIIVEFAIGPVEETIHRMIEIYKPDSLIVGTRGIPDSIFKSAFMGSISRYCVAKSPVPVVVVRPEDKVRESLQRRLQEPKKRSYLSLLGTDIIQNKEKLNELERSTSIPEQRVMVQERGDKEAGRKETKKGLEFKKFSTFS